MRTLQHVPLNLFCILTTLTLVGQQFAVHLANVPQVPLDLSIFCCGKRAKIEQGQACIRYSWNSCPSIINLIITIACRPVLDKPTPWLERCPGVETLWYQLELVDCQKGYTWQITEIVPARQPAFIPDNAVIVRMPAQCVDKVCLPGIAKDYLTTDSVMKSQALIHLPTIYMKNLTPSELALLRDDLDKALLYFELDMVHAQMSRDQKQVGSTVMNHMSGHHG